MNRIQVFCCLTLLVLSVIAQSQTDEGIKPDGFLVVSNSMHKAVMANRMMPRREVKLPKESFKHIRFFFDMMDSISLSNVEVICYRGLGIDANENLIFWLTRDAVYKIMFSQAMFWERDTSLSKDDGITLKRDNSGNIMGIDWGREKVKNHFQYTLSISKTMRTETFDAELTAFESVPPTESNQFSYDTPCGFYVRRTSDNTFESIYFPMVIKDISDDKMQLLQNKIFARIQKSSDKTRFRDGFNHPQTSAFNRLFEMFDKLMDKPEEI